MYACVRPHRYTYGNHWNMVAKVDASDSRCRCVGKIIARDLRLVASRLYRMAVTCSFTTIALIYHMFTIERLVLETLSNISQNYQKCLFFKNHSINSDYMLNKRPRDERTLNCKYHLYTLLYDRS